jgi:LPS O-antigen subunit length determinant protein (WzzB/FepE family)
MDTLHILVLLNLASTVIGIFWLRQKVQHQATIIETQTKQIEGLDKYSKILTQIYEKLDPNTVLKVLDNERLLMQQDTELLRRQTIKNVNEKLLKEWSASVKNNLMPQFDGIVSEFSNFIIFYFSQPYYSDKDLRNADIRTYFPNHGNIVITYFEQVRDKQPDQESNP